MEENSPQVTPKAPQRANASNIIVANAEKDVNGNLPVCGDKRQPPHTGKITRTGGTAQNGGFNSTSDARTAKTGAEYLAEAVTGRNAAPEQAQQNIDNNSDMGYNNINKMRGDMNA